MAQSAGPGMRSHMPKEDRLTQAKDGVYTMVAPLYLVLSNPESKATSPRQSQGTNVPVPKEMAKAQSKPRSSYSGLGCPLERREN